MKVIVINQEPLTVTPDQAKQIIQMIMNGSEMVVINGEMVKSSAIMGIRNSDNSKTLEKAQWGALPEGAMKHFYDDRREPNGDGYEKFKALKSKLMGQL